MTTDAAAIVGAALRATPLIDGHNDLISGIRLFHGYDVEGVGTGLADLQTDIPRLRAGMVGAQFWAAWVPTSLPPGDAVISTLEQIDGIRRMIARFPDTFAFARTADELERVFTSGRIASLIGVEGGHSIAESAGVLRCYARLGVRYLTLTHGSNTPWADSATDVRHLGGLSDAGVAVVAELNRIGMIVDLSHTSVETQRDALRCSAAPVLFTHSSAAAVTDHPRNVPDDVLAMLRVNGGVLQIAFVPEFLSADVAEWTALAAAERQRLELGGGLDWAPAPGLGVTCAEHRRQLAARAVADRDETPAHSEYRAWLDRHPRPTATRAQAVAHIEHAREAAGVDHVGIGADFDGMFVTPDGLADVAAYPALFEELAARHWSQSELEQLAGRNVLRVMRAVEAARTEDLDETYVDVPPPGTPRPTRTGVTKP